MPDEFESLTESAGLLDLSSRSRLCVLGTDRVKFLHGQVTNDIAGLTDNTGCYAALVNAKGKMECDLFAYRLAEELLLDFEPGHTEAIRARLEKFVIAEDVEIADVAPHFGLLSVQGPKAADALKATNLPIPEEDFAVTKTEAEIHVINNPRLGTRGFDLFVPIDALADWKGRLYDAATPCNEAAFERARILGTIPRFGVDLTKANLPPEGGLEDRAISYAKGCYIGQEVIARIRTYGQVTRVLRGLRLDGPAATGDGVFLKDKQVGALTSVDSTSGAALSLIRRECNDPGTQLRVDTQNGSVTAQVATLPFERFAL